MAHRTPLILLAVLAFAGVARAQGEPGPSFWAGVAHPHAAEVARLRARARDLRQQAMMRSDPHQTPLRERMLEDALAALQRAEALDPRDPALARELADVAFEASEYRVAAAAFLHLRELSPSAQDPEVALRLGVALAQDGRLEDAQAVLEQAQGWAPGSSSQVALLWALAYVDMAEGRLDDAIDVYLREQALLVSQGGGGDPQALLGLAIAYDRDEQIGRALEVLDQVKQVDGSLSFLWQSSVLAPTSVLFYAPPADRHYWFATAYEALGQLPEAAAEWRGYIESASPAYRRRAEEHLRQVEDELARLRPVRGKPR